MSTRRPLSPAPINGLGRFRVHYADEHADDVRVTSRGIVECERRWPGIETDGSDRYRPQEGVHYMVWISAGRPGGDFEGWLDAIVSVEPLDDEAPPTNPVPGAT